MPFQVCHRLSRRLSLSALALAATGALLACGDGSGTQPDNGAGTPPATNLAPTGVAQPTVKPGPLGSGTASATWAAASDDATAESALVYQLHASTQADFTPDSSTLVFEGTGARQASVPSGLVAGTRYTFKLVVKDAQGLASTGPGTSVAMYTATPHSGVTAQQCYQAGSDALVPCNSAGALALNSQQDGHRTAVNPMSYSEVPKPGGGFYARTECVQDNVTGLMWEGKETSGLRAGSSTYTNYDDPTQPQKWNGSAFGNPTQAEVDAATNSVGYAAYVNSIALCGHRDWRLPTMDELHSIFDYGASWPTPLVSAAWFPNSQRAWTAEPSEYPEAAWTLEFIVGFGGISHREGFYAVRLVRTGQR